MRCLLICLIVWIAASALAEETPVEVHYNQACLLRDQGDFAAALEEVAKGIALNPQDKEVLAKSELLSAQLYLKTGMVESALVAARQVSLLYKGTEFDTEAQTLLGEIDQLKEQAGKPE